MVIHGANDPRVPLSEAEQRFPLLFMMKRTTLAALLLLLLATGAPPAPVTGQKPDLQSASHLPVASVTQHEHERFDSIRTEALHCQTPSPNPAVLGVTPLSILDTGICSNADIDVYQAGNQTIVAQAGYDEAAFVLSDVTNPVHPTVIKKFVWGIDYGTPAAGSGTYTPDVKHFTNQGRHYLALSLERTTTFNYCGVVIMDVTDPANPVFAHQAFESDWCDVHNSFVEKDVNGDGAYLYLTADATSDLRVLDIRDLSSITEVGRYTHPNAGGNNFVHDVTVINGRVYVAYWDAGLIILNAADLTPEVDPPVPLNPLDSIKPASFAVHHAYPSEDGNYVFIEDEVTTQEPVRMFDIQSLNSPTVVDAVSVSGTLAHNLHVEGGRLYVGWYEAGLQGFEISNPNLNADPFELTPLATPTSLTRVLYHTVRDNPAASYDGAWGVRLHDCTVGGVERTCIYTSDISIGLIVDMLKDPARCHPADHDCDDDVDATDLQTQAGHWRDAPPVDPKFNLNTDSHVDIVDIQIAALAWGWPLLP